MKTHATSFGSLTPVLVRDGKTVAEFGVFEREGRAHAHEEWEICFVQKGGGTIVVGDARHLVSEGQTLAIPPATPHWMIPEDGRSFEILIVYSPEGVA